MAKRFFYDKKNGKYVGSTNTAAACPVECSETSKDVAGSSGVFEGDGWLECAGDQVENISLEKVKNPTKSADSYAITVAAYSDRQIQGGLIRAKNPKREVLLAEKLKREVLLAKNPKREVLLAEKLKRES